MRAHKHLETKTLSLFQLLASQHLLMSVIQAVIQITQVVQTSAILLIIKNYRLITTQVTNHKRDTINQQATITTL